MFLVQQNHKIITLFMGDTIFWFPKGRKECTWKFNKWWFGLYKIQYYLPNNIVLLVDIDKFELNPIFVNINKHKPYWYLGQAPRELEATIKGGGKHKENSKNKDLGEDFQDILPKI